MIATLRQAPIQLQPNFWSNRRTAAAKRAYIHRSSAQAEGLRPRFVPAPGRWFVT